MEIAGILFVEENGVISALTGISKRVEPLKRVLERYSFRFSDPSAGKAVYESPVYTGIISVTKIEIYVDKLPETFFDDLVKEVVYASRTSR